MFRLKGRRKKEEHSFMPLRENGGKEERKGVEDKEKEKSRSRAGARESMSIKAFATPRSRPKKGLEKQSTRVLKNKNKKNRGGRTPKSGRKNAETAD